jgi:hypothetical protein
VCLSPILVFRYSKRPLYIRFSTCVSLHCPSLGPYLGFIVITVSFFSARLQVPCILYSFMYARMFVLFVIDWFVVVSIAQVRLIEHPYENLAELKRSGTRQVRKESLWEGVIDQRKWERLLTTFRASHFIFSPPLSLSVHRRLSQLYHCSSTFFEPCFGLGDWLCLVTPGEK